MTVSRMVVEKSCDIIRHLVGSDSFLATVLVKLESELLNNPFDSRLTIEASEPGAVRFVQWICSKAPSSIGDEWLDAFHAANAKQPEPSYHPTPDDLANARQSDAELDAIEANRIEAERWARSMFLEVPRDPQIKSRLLDNWRTKPGQSDWQRWSNRVEKYTGPMDRPAAELKAAAEIWPADEPPKQASLFD